MIYEKFQQQKKLFTISRKRLCLNRLDELCSLTEKKFLEKKTIQFEVTDYMTRLLGKIVYDCLIYCFVSSLKRRKRNIKIAKES